MNEQLSSLLRRKEVIPASVGLVAFIGGGALGYILGKRRREVYEVNLTENEYVFGSQEGGELVFDTNEVTVRGEFFPNPVKPIDPVHVITSGYLHSVGPVIGDDAPGYIVAVTPLEDENDTGITVIEEPDDGEWDWEAEKSTRHSHEPYIIHLTEFDEDNMGFTQSQVNYYAGDDVLTDEHEKPVYGHSALLGELKFGHGSGDPSIVFIRNELLEHEYEVILNQGHYAVEVLGLEIDEKYSEQDLKHSKVQRFRMD